MAGPLNTPAHRPFTLRKRLLRFGIILLVLLLAIGGWGWWTFVSPLNYSPPSSTVVEAGAGEQRVFAYGTLCNPLVRLLITRELTDPTLAHLPGYRKQGLDIIKVDSATTAGMVFSVTPQGLRRLDRYERVGERYQRLQLTLADGKPAWVYQRLQE
ncbi:MAG TPA: gamma-glutamylcyclotransferase family protein [Pelovirga sp.]|nr:gamma-glutamylcyclotransferase family protein [Pelovirga sp.]